MATISNLYRYPIKGLSPEPLTEIAVSHAHGLPFDRAYALALGTTRFDPQAPEPLDKGYFLMLRKNEKLAALATRLDPATGRLTIRHRGECVLDAAVTEAAGQAAVADFMFAWLGEATAGRPRLVSAAGHKFTDVSVVSPVMMKAISVINLASVRSLEAATGTQVHPLRFRANIYIDGVPPWAELDWVGRQIEIGGVRFRGALRTRRCAAIDVNPETAARDTNLPKAIMQHVGHTDLGIYLEVLSDGVCSVGDAVIVDPASPPQPAPSTTHQTGIILGAADSDS
jgi:hypothetical protein